MRKPSFLDMIEQRHLAIVFSNTYFINVLFNCKLSEKEKQIEMFEVLCFFFWRNLVTVCRVFCSSCIFSYKLNFGQIFFVKPLVSLPFMVNALNECLSKSLLKSVILLPFLESLKNVM